ncbi:MAG: sigma-70 family RNA polymerase sigma factor [Bacteroidetes bacterium]|nr:sigma-70 family RNA polymerase sigma factor [Bacteroidota bacterium]
MNLETSAIIEAIKAGSEKILLNIYEAHRNDFISWATHNHHVSREEAKDIFQESVIAFYKNVKMDKLKSLDVSFKTYLFSIGKNIMLNVVKRKGIESKALEGFTESNDNGISEHYEKEHLINFVKRLYQAMGSPCKEILEMFYERGFDMESIAVRIGYKNADVAKKKKYECLKTFEDRINMSHFKNIIN